MLLLFSIIAFSNHANMQKHIRINPWCKTHVEREMVDSLKRSNPYLKMSY
ncbi:hypothetical protein [Candidatus Cytomitobacter primus]|nr:hypothetical protein [Candidatus Cytomitobacter primus]